MSFQQQRWLTRYRSTTSDILNEFYIPALRLTRRYDRVAGYFRSTSLAAAAQGFSALTRNQGRVRLVVGADLDPLDAQVILDQHDEGRLTAALLAMLDDDSHCRSEAVENGLVWLAWMLKSGALELRVALRRHRTTGAAIAYDSLEDGYVHEKWAIFTDAEGNRLIAEGSLNESRTALVVNAENIGIHCDWWGEHEASRADSYAADFVRIWSNEDPGLYVVDLPQAVRERLVEFAGNGAADTHGNSTGNGAADTHGNVAGNIAGNSAENVNENANKKTNETTNRNKNETTNGNTNGNAAARPWGIDGASEIPSVVPTPSAREWLQFAILREAPRMPNGRLVGMMTAPVKPWPNQAIVARRLISSYPYSFLLCDEVGLGKTIEAGLALRSLLLTGLARRVLIAPPAGLARQWTNELAGKFFLRFARALPGPQPRHEYQHPQEETLSATSIFGPEQVIVSTGLVRRKERQQELSAQHWDIVLVDEAHYARRSNSAAGRNVQPKYGDLYQAIEKTLRPHTRALWLATATPMQIAPIEVYDLLRLTRRVGPFQEDPSLTHAYYEIQGRLQRGEKIPDHELNFIRSILDSVRYQDPELDQFIRQTVLNTTTLHQLENWLKLGVKPTATALKNLLRAIFASAPLSRVMMRHNRALLRVYQEKGQLTSNLARRHILPLEKIEFTEDEKAAYEALEVYSKELARQMTAANTQQPHAQQVQASTGFYLSFLQRRFASSLYAIGETLKRRRERVQATLTQQLTEASVSGSASVSASAATTASASALTSTSTPTSGSASVSAAAARAVKAALAAGARTEVKTDPSHLEEDLEPEEDAEVIQHVLKHRTVDDLLWELSELDAMLGSGIYDSGALPSKTQALLGYVNQNRSSDRPGRYRQTVIFTQFWDTLQDLVSRLRQVDAKLLLGTYSGRGGQYVDPETGQLRETERDEIKQRFLRGQIDILVCTDAAAEGLNLQTADFLINFDLPWNPAKVEQRIGRIDRIGQINADIYVQNLCYLGSVEEIVYGRLLERLTDMITVVGDQQISMLPVTEEDFRQLADGEKTEQQLEAEARERLATTQQRVRETELTGPEVYQIYQRLEKHYATEQRPPVTLDEIWAVVNGSATLQALGCAPAAHLNIGHAIGQTTGHTTDHTIGHTTGYPQPFMVRGVPGIIDGTALTTDRKLYEDGIEDLGARLRFATYGEPAFDTLLAFSAAWTPPACVRRISVTPKGLDIDYVAFVVATHDVSGSKSGSKSGSTRQLVTHLEMLADLDLDVSVSVSEADVEPFREQLQKLADEEYRLTAHVSQVEQDNQRSGHAQAALALGTAYGMISERQKTHGADANFWKELEACRKMVSERTHAGGGFNIQRIPSDYDKLATARVPFEVKKKVSDASYWVQAAPPVLLHAALDAAERVGANLGKKKFGVSTDQGIRRIAAEMKRWLNAPKVQA